MLFPFAASLAILNTEDFTECLEVKLIIPTYIRRERVFRIPDIRHRKYDVLDICENFMYEIIERCVYFCSVMIAQRECISLFVLSGSSRVQFQAMAISKDFFLADQSHQTLPASCKPVWQKMAQSPFNGITQLMNIQEEGRSLTVDRDHLEAYSSNFSNSYHCNKTATAFLFLVETLTDSLGYEIPCQTCHFTAHL